MLPFGANRDGMVEQTSLGGSDWSLQDLVTQLHAPGSLVDVHH